PRASPPGRPVAFPDSPEGHSIVPETAARAHSFSPRSPPCSGLVSANPGPDVLRARVVARRPGSRRTAEEGDQLVLLGGVLRHAHRRTEELLTAERGPEADGLRVHPADLVQRQRLVPAGGPGDVPGVDQQVEAEEPVDGLLQSGPPEVPVVLEPGAGGILEDLLHDVARLEPRADRVLGGALAHLDGEPGIAGHAPVDGDDVAQHVPGRPSRARGRGLPPAGGNGLHAAGELGGQPAVTLGNLRDTLGHDPSMAPHPHPCRVRIGHPPRRGRRLRALEKMSRASPTLRFGRRTACARRPGAARTSRRSRPDPVSARCHDGTRWAIVTGETRAPRSYPTALRRPSPGVTTVPWTAVVPGGARGPVTPNSTRERGPAARPPVQPLTKASGLLAERAEEILRETWS